MWNYSQCLRLILEARSVAEAVDKVFRAAQHNTCRSLEDIEAFVIVFLSPRTMTLDQRLAQVPADARSELTRVAYCYLREPRAEAAGDERAAEHAADRADDGAEQLEEGADDGERVLHHRATARRC